LRTDEQLIQSALGDPEFSLDCAEPPQKRGLFRLYVLQLPERFKRGLPPIWQFAVLTSSLKSSGKSLAEQIVDEARSIIDLKGKDDLLLVFLSDYPHIRLYDRLPQTNARVFALDHHELPGGRPRKYFTDMSTSRPLRGHNAGLDRRFKGRQVEYA
jgi:hypothetical protein